MLKGAGRETSFVIKHRCPRNRVGSVESPGSANRGRLSRKGRVLELNKAQSIGTGSANRYT